MARLDQAQSAPDGLDTPVLTPWGTALRRSSLEICHRHISFTLGLSRVQVSFRKAEEPTLMGRLFYLVEVARLELAASTSRTWRATNCATPRKKQPRNKFAAEAVLAAVPGFEPRQTESESAVLPLHNTALCRCLNSNIYYIQKVAVVKEKMKIFLFSSDRALHRQHSGPIMKEKNH